MNRSVRELLGSMDSAELTEWFGFMLIEPLPEVRADLRAGIVASAVANHGAREIKKPYRPIDFMPLAQSQEPEAILLPDADEQSDLILSAVFLRKV